MKLLVGCGRHHREGYVNLDIAKMPGVDVVHDLDKFPYPFKDNTFSEIVAEHVLEHLADLMSVMREFHRISKQGGIIKIVVPYYHSHGAFQDPTISVFLRWILLIISQTRLFLPIILISSLKL